MNLGPWTANFSIQRGEEYRNQMVPPPAGEVMRVPVLSKAVAALQYLNVDHDPPRTGLQTMMP